MITLVLLPGMDGTGILFANFISALGPRYTTCVVTYPADPSLGYNELEVIARSFLPRDQPFVLVAESFSGPIAISIAASGPPGLTGLVLCCSFARNPRALLARLGSFLKLFPIHLLPFAISGKFLLGRFSSASLRASIREALATVSSNTLRARVKAVAAIDVSTKLGHVRVPILYLRATHDLLVTRAAGNHILKTAPNVQMAELDGPHLLLQVAPSAAAKIVSDFLRNAIKIPNEP